MKRLIENGLMKYGLLILFSFLSLLLLFSCEESAGPLEDTTPSTYKLTVTPASGTISANGDSIQILVKVSSYTDTTKAISGVSVSFATTEADSILSLRIDNSITDSNGYAKATVFSIVKSGTVAVTASVQVSSKEKYSNKVYITVVPGTGLPSPTPKDIKMKITSNPSVLSANGTDTSTITASLRDVDGNPVPGVTVYFTTTDGVIKTSSETNEWGDATIELKSARYNAISQVTAKYGSIERTTNVEFEGTELKLTASSLVLVADNTEELKLTISYLDASSSAIVDEKITVSTTRGTLLMADGISGGTTIVDSTATDGSITAYIKSNETGDAIVTVTATGSVDTLTINFTGYTFSLTAEDEEILAGGQKTSVTAILRDISGVSTPIDIDKISFSTTLGDIETITKNMDGSVSAEVISGSSAGMATVTASMPDPQVNATVSIAFNAANVDSVYIESDKPTVKLGGSSVSIQSTVFDETGNPKKDETVTFSILKGPGGGEQIVPGTAVTDERGQAFVSFITGNRGSEKEGVQIQAKLGTIKSNIIYLTISGEPSSVQVGYADWYSEEENGTYGLEITAIVSDVNRNEVVDGTIVNFSIVGDAGVIEPQVSTIDGVATTKLLYSPSDAGKEITLTASASGVKDDIKIPLPGFKPSYMTLIAEPLSIPADGKSEITVRVTLFDKSGSSESVPDGTMVAFSTEGGTLTPNVGRTVDGVAEVILKSDKNPGKIKIGANSGELENFTYVDFEEVGTTVNEVSTIKLSVDDPVLRADGISSTYIHATLERFDGTIITKPTTVNFETTIGEVTQSVLSDSTTGTAVAQFSSNQVGTAQIRASVGEVYDFIDVFLIPGPPVSINLSFDPKNVGIQGSGRDVTLLITADVMDEKNNAVADSNLVLFELVGWVDAEAVLSPPSAADNHVSEAVPTVNGAAVVSFTSGKISGTVRIRATIVDKDGNPVSPLISSETTEFQVFSGPPYLDEMPNPNDPFTESRVTLAGGPLNIFAGELDTENSRSTITAIFGDKYNNPVPENTAVWFTTTGGVVSTNTAFTDENGLARVTLYAGNPFPTLQNSITVDNPNVQLIGDATFDLPTWDFDVDGLPNNGIAYVIAEAKGLDHLDRQVQVWNYVPIIFSLSPTTFEVTVSSTSLGLGETAIIDIIVHDINGNPVMGGSEITFSSENGALSSKLIETSSFATQYSVALTNNLDPFTSIETTTVVNVSLSSPNGDVATISPTITLRIVP